MPVPKADLAHVRDAHDRFLRAVERLTDEDMRVPSRLPGWTAGHVLTHVARNADSHVRRAEAALLGEMVDQYEGGYAGRALAIGVGSLRSVVEIIRDVGSSARLIEEVWRRLPVGAWTCRSRDVNGRERPLFELPSRRCKRSRYTWSISMWVYRTGTGRRSSSSSGCRARERMWNQLPVEASYGAWDHPADELAWLYGRFSRTDLPAPPEWGEHVPARKATFWAAGDQSWISSRPADLGIVQRPEPRTVGLAAHDLGSSTGAVLGCRRGEGEVAARDRRERFLWLEVRSGREHRRPQLADRCLAHGLAAWRISHDSVLLVERSDALCVTRIRPFDKETCDVLGVRGLLVGGHAFIISQPLSNP